MQMTDSAFPLDMKRTAGMNCLKTTWAPANKRTEAMSHDRRFTADSCLCTCRLHLLHFVCSRCDFQSMSESSRKQDPQLMLTGTSAVGFSIRQPQSSASNRAPASKQFQGGACKGVSGELSRWHLPEKLLTLETADQHLRTFPLCRIQSRTNIHGLASLNFHRAHVVPR